MDAELNQINNFCLLAPKLCAGDEKKKCGLLNLFSRESA